MKIILATNNLGKLHELVPIFSDLPLQLIPQSEFDVPEAEETGLTFVENALLKARNACAHTGLPAIADDSGIVVDYLKGAPGIYSARYAGKGGTAEACNQKLLAALTDVPPAERTARFRCAMVFLRHETDPAPIICQGVWEGVIATEFHGEGFGYDPLFWLPERQCSAGQLTRAEKNAVSHRGQAVSALLAAMEKESLAINP